MATRTFLFKISRIFLLLAITASVSADDNDPPPKFDFNNMGGGPAKFCPPFKCTKGYEPVPKWPLKLTSTGCSSMMGGLAMLSPGTADDPDDPIKPCCDLRNACYQVCGISKSYCDDSYQKCSEDACEAVADDEEKKKACDSKVSVNKMLMGLGGDCNTYDAGQKASCQCLTKGEKAQNGRKQMVRNFYKKFNPDGLEKVDSLVKKSGDSTKKFAGLLYKLVEKYPKAIKQVKDPQQEYLEKLMKDADKKKGDEGEEGEDESSGSTTDDVGTEDLDADEERVEL